MGGFPRPRRLRGAYVMLSRRKAPWGSQVGRLGGSLPDARLGGSLSRQTPGVSFLLSSRPPYVTSERSQGPRNRD